MRDRIDPAFITIEILGMHIFSGRNNDRIENYKRFDFMARAT